MNALLCIFCYLLGSLAFGKWIAAAYGVDILREGSQTIGATNVWRNLGWKAGLCVFILDAAKGYAAAWLGGNLPRIMIGDHGYDYRLALIAGGCAVLGHSASVFLKFKGGKSVATALGVLLAISPDVAGLSLFVFIFVLAMWRYVSLGSLSGSITAPVFALAFGYPRFVVWTYVGLALLIAVRHKNNIERLVRGEEYKFGEAKTREGTIP